MIRQSQISDLDNLFLHSLCLRDFGEHSGYEASGMPPKRRREGSDINVLL